MGTYKSAIVAGAGVIGLACAFRLQEAGYATTLFDPAPARPSASWGNAGHLAVEQVEPLASRRMIASAPGRLFALGGALDLPPSQIAAWGPFLARFLRASAPARFAAGKAALAAWLEAAIPAWRRLAADIGAPDLVREDGHYVVWGSARAAARGEAAWRRVGAATAAFRPASPAERARLETMIRAPLAGAIRFERSGQIADLVALRQALESAFERAGGRRRKQAVARLDVRNDAARAIDETGGEHQADIVLVAAGTGARALLEPLGVRVPVVAERGYHIEASAGGWPAGFPPLVFEDRAVIATRFARSLRLCSFVEFARPDSPPDPRKWRRLRRHAAELGLPLEEPTREWMGARPTLPDYLPAVGASPAASGLLYAFGHQHLGLTLAAVTGEAVAALAQERAPAVDPAPFDLARFGRGSLYKEQ
ncbi:NAD(P)/FAD-dependent oxidoreductase [Amphiplicatus metriothermophilus]|uniref:D-amino-acid dehydrogenase n=1 Tax=Amphiplicatus metriothermophilus TaxID=1519374 RepID=A0A239PRV5_9PROT|nr:FAD-binding oxidoreductase [Amphiplicatus metriothermophilus]MBB5518401.1 D-amino-acid dehydrogenase [Amphiplicatus metriothermophilus]SNT72437.1 D-amino-acid dehydrogenase [Amphiplicatus metriothermophilus]